MVDEPFVFWLLGSASMVLYICGLTDAASAGVTAAYLALCAVTVGR